MTLTDTDSSVWIAPAGTALDDAGAWTHIGYTRELTLAAEEDPFTMPLPLGRILPPIHLQCERTVHVIEGHAQRKRIAAVLTKALPSARLPCPVPFPTSAVLRGCSTRPWACLPDS